MNSWIFQSFPFKRTTITSSTQSDSGKKLTGLKKLQCSFVHFKNAADKKIDFFPFSSLEK